MWPFTRKQPPPQPEVIRKPGGMFASPLLDGKPIDPELMDRFQQRVFQRKINKDVSGGIAMDDDSTKAAFGAGLSMGETVSEDQLNWYASQSFIGYQVCAILAQHWLIDKACQVPARDYCRHGWEVTVNGGVEASPEVLEFIHKQDKFYRIKHHLVEFIHYGRIFGVRFALPIVNGGPNGDPAFYEKPYNPDGIKPGSYQGISQIDPYWVAPFISGEAASNYAAIDFYEPTWWQVAGKKVHRSHVLLMRNGSVPDILKPTYFYGGVPVPQRIADRVYAAERTANEAPLLALSKRLTTLTIDTEAGIAQFSDLQAKLNNFAYLRNNYGAYVLGEGEEMSQHDTALADLSDVISGQYALVAAAADIPITKLLGTPPKGMDATGEYDEANYHEMLESLQEHDGTPLLDRHYECLIRSDIVPKFGLKDLSVAVAWNKLDAMTAEEKARVNEIKAKTDAALAMTGAIDGQDIRDRLIADKESGYNGLKREVPEPMLDEGDGAAFDAWNEGDHPRDDAGQFTSGTKEHHQTQLLRTQERLHAIETKYEPLIRNAEGADIDRLLDERNALMEPVEKQHEFHQGRISDMEYEENTSQEDKRADAAESERLHKLFSRNQYLEVVAHLKAGGRATLGVMTGQGRLLDKNSLSKIRPAKNGMEVQVGREWLFFPNTSVALHD
jgi:phage-related protein (TIGR01555 family)